MKLVLMVATVFKFLNFEKSDIEILQSMGYEVHTATNMREAKWLQDDGTFENNPIIRHQIDFGRSPYSKDNIKAYKQLEKLLSEYQFELIHCHTPVAAAITRIAANKYRKKETKVIYTSHGFHFHKTSSLKSWLLYYPIEKMLASRTDVIITINKEDYSVIQKFRVKEKRYIPGVGVDVDHIHSLKVDRNEILGEFGIPENAFVILTIGELSDRKNQSVVIKALKSFKKESIYYILCGTGQKEQGYKKLAKKTGLENHVIFAGQRDHEWVMKLAHAVDLGAIPSKIEGLGLAGIEILAAGTPLIGSDVHGIKDYLIDGKTGISCNPNNYKSFSEAIYKLLNNKKYYKQVSLSAYSIAAQFDISISRRTMIEIYSKLLGNNSLKGEQCKK